METKEFNENFKNIEKAMEIISHAKSLTDKEKDEVFNSLDMAQYYMTEYRNLSREEGIIIWNEYGDIAEKALKDFASQELMTIGSIEVEKTDNCFNFKIKPTKAYVLFNWGRLYGQAIKELESN